MGIFRRDENTVITGGVFGGENHGIEGGTFHGAIHYDSSDATAERQRAIEEEADRRARAAWAARDAERQ